MKKLFFLSVIVLVNTAVFAQKAKPVIKVGTTATMDLDYHGQPLQLGVLIKSIGDVINMDWNVSGTGGTFAMKAKALASGTKFGGDQPTPDAVTALTDEETFMCISKAAYQTMLKSKTFTYSGITYTVKDNADGFKIAGQAMDATFAASADGKISVWVLNNPEFPLTLAMKGSTNGIDYTLTELK